MKVCQECHHLDGGNVVSCMLCGGASWKWLEMPNELELVPTLEPVEPASNPPRRKGRK